MNTKPIYVTSADHLRLKQLLTSLASMGGTGKAPAKLEAELKRAVVIDPTAATEGLVTLNSEVTIRDQDTDELETYTITMPQEAGRVAGTISVLAPIGCALLGYSVGDEISWETPGGVRRIRIESAAPAALSKRVPAYSPEHILGTRSPT